MHSVVSHSLGMHLSSYGYLALSPSFCKFRPVNSWVCQNGLTCIKRSVDHSPTMTAQFRFDLRNNCFYTFIRLPVSIRTPVSLFICHSQLPVLWQNGKKSFFKNRTKYTTISMPRGGHNRLSFTATRESYNVNVAKTCKLRLLHMQGWCRFLSISCLGLHKSWDTTANNKLTSFIALQDHVFPLHVV